MVECQDVRKKEKIRPRKRWTDEVEEDLKIMGIRNQHTVPSDRKKRGRIVMESKGS